MDALKAEARRIAEEVEELSSRTAKEVAMRGSSMPRNAQFRAVGWAMCQR